MEVYYEGELADGAHHPGGWGTVCEDGFGRVDAAVVCRELGHGAAMAALPGGVFGNGDGPVLLDEVQCDGTERLLADCLAEGLAGVGRHDCGPHEAAVSGDRLTLRFDAPLDAIFRPARGDFAVLANGAARPVTGVRVAGPRLTLTVAEPVGAEDQVVAGYFAPALFPLVGLHGQGSRPLSTWRRAT